MHYGTDCHMANNQCPQVTLKRLSLDPFANISFGCFFSVSDKSGEFCYHFSASHNFIQAVIPLLTYMTAKQKVLLFLTYFCFYSLLYQVLPLNGNIQLFLFPLTLQFDCRRMSVCSVKTLIILKLIELFKIVLKILIGSSIYTKHNHF